MIVKKHSTPEMQLILAVCDSKHLGKQYEEGEALLDLSGDFFKGEEMNEREVLELFDVAYIVNAVGEKSVSLLVENNFANKEDVKKVAEIPHIQAILIRE